MDSAMDVGKLYKTTASESLRWKTVNSTWPPKLTWRIYKLRWTWRLILAVSIATTASTAIVGILLQSQ